MFFGLFTPIAICGEIKFEGNKRVSFKVRNKPLVTPFVSSIRFRQQVPHCMQAKIITLNPVSIPISSFGSGYNSFAFISDMALNNALLNNRFLGITFEQKEVFK